MHECVCVFIRGVKYTDTHKYILGVCITKFTQKLLNYGTEQRNLYMNSLGVCITKLTGKLLNYGTQQRNLYTNSFTKRPDRNFFWTHVTTPLLMNAYL